MIFKILVHKIAEIQNTKYLEREVKQSTKGAYY